jgi:hypothetical protein
MSWSRSYSSLGAFRADQSSPSAPDQNGPNAESRETLEAIEQARGLAARAIRSGVFGDEAECDFSIILSGHANPGHRPRSGWANDCVTISVVQREKTKVEGEEIVTKPNRAPEPEPEPIDGEGEE